MKSVTMALLMMICINMITAQAQPSVIDDAIRRKSAEISQKVIEWRRYLHEHPELSNREFNTSKYVEKHLRGLGLEVRTGIAHTGVVAILKGDKPGPVIGLRADMDALPVTERVKLPFASKDSAMYNGQKVGVMHACGHDAHVAILMGTAEVLTGMKKDIAGTVVFVFQPAEEGPPIGEKGGAKLMIEEGVMDNPKIDLMFGLHMSSNTPSGEIRYKAGAFMASSDLFTVKIRGKQSHGSQPWLGIDPIVTGAQIVNGLQTIVSRESELTKAPVIITVGKFHGGVRENIIPEEMELSGTIRTLDAQMRTDVHEKIRRTAQNIAEANGATAEISIREQTLVTFNDIELTKQAVKSLEKAAGTSKVKEIEWRTGAEDFSYFGTKAPSFFFNLGGMVAGQNEKTAPPHHTPDFFIDDSRLDLGVLAFCQLVFDFGEKK